MTDVLDRPDTDTTNSAYEPKVFTFPRAQLMSVGATKGSTNSGQKGGVKFEVDRQSLAPLFDEGFEDAAYEVKFGRYALGVAIISNASGRPDAEGAAKAYINLVYSQTEVKKLAAILKDDLVGTVDRLILSSEQMQFTLTTKAE